MAEYIDPGDRLGALSARPRAYGRDMVNPCFLRQKLSVLTILSALGGLAVGCGADAPTPIKTEPVDSPSKGDDDEQDESASDSDDGDDAPSGPKAPLDAGTKPPVKADAGSTKPAPTDAGTSDAAVSVPGLDASTASADDAATLPTATDAGTLQPTKDAGVVVPPTDAAAPAPDAGAPVKSHVVKVDSKAVWAASGFKVQTGKCYVIEAKIDDKWLDLDVPADLTGWIDKKDARLGLFAPLRRVVQADIGFYQFATCVNKDTKHCFPVNTTSEVCPKLAGELFFFVNDVSGFESNNVGTATVTIREK